MQVIFDPAVISYEELAKLFFETHDFSQVNRQGPDIGTQYRSEIFYLDPAQKQTAEKLIGVLNAKGFQVATRLSQAGPFWPAEEYHQEYFIKNGQQPYCHVYRKIF